LDINTKEFRPAPSHSLVPIPTFPIEELTVDFSIEADPRDDETPEVNHNSWFSGISGNIERTPTAKYRIHSELK
jgi:hypothetical protein